MTRTKARKPKLVKKADAVKTKNITTNKIQKTKLKKKKKKALQKTVALPKQDNAQITNSSDTESDSEPEPEQIHKLLEPYTKDQLIDFIIDAAVKDATLFNRIRDAADLSVSHRKIFVHGLAWGTTREILASTFQQYGELEDYTVVVDRNTGKTKGYGFIVFKTRKGVKKALRQPKKEIGNRTVWCQLASVGPVTPAQDIANRRIYVSNVSSDVDPEKLRAFFEKFGEIERGPMGFDNQTRKLRGYAIFLYMTVEGAKKCLEEPYKMFEGHQLHCEKATEGKNKGVAGGGVASVTTSVQPIQPEVLAAVAAAQQNMALFGQYHGFNPLYGGLIGTGASAMNPLVAAGGLGLVGQVGASGVGGMHNLGGFGGTPSLLGGYGGSSDTGLQHVYPNVQAGQTSLPYGTGGSSSDYPSYM